MSVNTRRNAFEFLRELPTPRPFVWYKFVEQRRRAYGLACLILLVICVIIPLIISLGEVRNEYSGNRIRPNQIALYFGALVVVAVVRYSYILQKLWDDSRRLARYGRLEEANLLWVIRGKGRLIITYRFWTPKGEEVMKETVIDADGPQPLAALVAGDIVPVLYDPRNPKRGSMLWAEIERYAILSERPVKRRGQAPIQPSETTIQT